MGTVLGTVDVVRVKSATARWLETCFCRTARSDMPRTVPALTRPDSGNRSVSSDSAACAHVHVAAREWLVCPGGALRCAGCEDATQPRTVDKARRRIVEAMDMFVADAQRARIVDDVKLPSGAAKALRTYATLRKSADEEERRAA